MGSLVLRSGPVARRERTIKLPISHARNPLQSGRTRFAGAPRPQHATDVGRVRSGGVRLRCAAGQECAVWRRLTPGQQASSYTTRRTTAPARLKRLASPAYRPRPGLGRPLDGSLSRDEAPFRDRRRSPPAQIIRLEFLSASTSPSAPWAGSPSVGRAPEALFGT